jgi:hypothetical protein
MNVAYKNFSDMDSEPLTGCIKQGIYALVLTDIIIIVKYYFNISYCMESYTVISKETREKLTVHTITSIV